MSVDATKPTDNSAIVTWPEIIRAIAIAVNTNETDILAGGIKWKTACRAATTANIVLSGTQTIDGVDIIADDRVLVKDQTDLSENGIYVASGSTWVRADDANTAAEILRMAVNITEGIISAHWTYINNDDSIILDTDDINFTVYNSIVSASEIIRGIIELATTAEAITGTDTSRAITAAGLTAFLANNIASITAQGIVELATSAEAITGTDTERAITPAALHAKTTSETEIGLIELATSAEGIAGTDAIRAITAAVLKLVLASPPAIGTTAPGTVFSSLFTCTGNATIAGEIIGDLKGDVYDSSGTRKVLDNGALTTEAALTGVVDIKSCTVLNAAVTVIATATPTLLTFDTEDHDDFPLNTTGFHSTISNTGRLTVPANCSKVILSASLFFPDNATGIRQFIIFKADSNPAIETFGMVVPAALVGIGNYFTLYGSSQVINVSEGDYFTITVYQNSGGNLSLHAKSSFSIHRVG